MNYSHTQNAAFVMYPDFARKIVKYLRISEIDCEISELLWIFWVPRDTIKCGPPKWRYSQDELRWMRHYYGQHTSLAKYPYPPCLHELWERIKFFTVLKSGLIYRMHAWLDGTTQRVFIGTWREAMLFVRDERHLQPITIVKCD